MRLYRSVDEVIMKVKDEISWFQREIDVCRSGVVFTFGLGYRYNIDEIKVNFI